jgi:hypothetical protein
LPFLVADFDEIGVLVSSLQPSCANQDSEKRIFRCEGVPIEVSQLPFI